MHVDDGPAIVTRSGKADVVEEKTAGAGTRRGKSFSLFDVITDQGGRWPGADDLVASRYTKNSIPVEFSQTGRLGKLDVRLCPISSIRTTHRVSDAKGLPQHAAHDVIGDVMHARIAGAASLGKRDTASYS